MPVAVWLIIFNVFKSKIVIAPPDTPVGQVLARGGADIGFQQVSELLHVKGIDYLGPLPADVQETTAFAAALHTMAKTPDAALAFMDALIPVAAANAGRDALATGGRRHVPYGNHLEGKSPL